MNPQTKCEAGRILAVIDEALDDLELLSFLPQFYNNLSKDDLAHLSGGDSAKAAATLSGHFDLERRLEVSSDPVDLQNHIQSTNAVVSLLKASGCGHEYQPSTGPSDAIARFKKVIGILRGLMNNNFSTTVEEDDQKLQILRDTVSREQHASADVKALNREFMTERKLRQTEVLKKDQAIHKLMDDLEEVQRKAHEDLVDYERVAEEKQSLEQQQAAQDEGDLENKVADLEAQLAKLKEANQRDEGTLRAERKKKENNLSTIITDYDREMTQKTGEKEKLQYEFEEDSTELAKVEAELKQFEEENTRWAEEDQIKMEAIKHRAVIKHRMDDSAKTVQAFWRCFAERNNLKKKAKKKGKGKK
ncbi:hypothetical protein DIPPA_21230 [Diplonema papillatum]|nr:hypothetical protein DIPPA_21230 [Diplonema papillatum]